MFSIERIDGFIYFNKNNSFYSVALLILNSFHILAKDKKGGNKMSEELIGGAVLSFPLIVVLFILLIIIGASIFGNDHGGCGGY
jgi:uncharacterized protein (TIGR01732 family)